MAQQHDAAGPVLDRGAFAFMLADVSVPADVLSVIVAFVLGAGIGAEREWRLHPGGLRSCAVVATAACVSARIAVIYGGTNEAAPVRWTP